MRHCAKGFVKLIPLRVPSTTGTHPGAIPCVGFSKIDDVGRKRVCSRPEVGEPKLMEHVAAGSHKPRESHKITIGTQRMTRDLVQCKDVRE